MKKLIVLLTFCFISIIGLGQSIKVPDFADAKIKSFYKTYSDHLLKCVAAIRQNDHIKLKALFKEGEPIVAREKVLMKEVMKSPAEKQKWMQWATQASPYAKKVENYYQLMHRK